MCGAEGVDGDCRVATALYRYDRVADRFVRVFFNLTGRNNNQATRFVEQRIAAGERDRRLPYRARALYLLG
jgi:hypothetical protein